LETFSPSDPAALDQEAELAVPASASALAGYSTPGPVGIRAGRMPALPATPAPALLASSLLQEIELAREIQRAQIPRRFPSIPGFGLAGFSLSARHLGGDYFDALPIAKGKVLLAVADVMGKGVPAALFTGTLRPLLRTLAESTPDPAGLLARLNRLLYQELEAADVFITMQLALVDSKRDRMTVASAGHCPLLLCDHTGATNAISADGMPLGILPDASFNQVVLPLDGCSCAFLFTDGMLDCFGQNQLADWIKRALGRAQTASELGANLTAELLSLRAQTLPTDDQTFLLLARELHLQETA
jgi:serine phosphatase RsbU (regulator of sigma subunit)